MVIIHWSSKAINRINGIASYLEDIEGSSEFAKKFVNDIFNEVKRLIDFPQIGRKVPDFDDPSIRELIFKNYRIIYHYSNDIIEIMTVEHCRRVLKS